MSFPIPPTITNTITPVISLSMPVQLEGVGTSYNQFLQSLGKYNYGVEFFYMASTSYRQIGQPVYYNHFEANGNSVTTFLPFTVDPYQSQPTMYYETEPDQIILTGLSSLQFFVLPNTSVFFKFFAEIIYVGNELDDKASGGGDNAFEDFDKRSGLNFFEDYCNYLLDTDF